MVNSSLLGDIPAPKRWEDFLDPKWKGKVAIADPNNSSTAYTILRGVAQGEFVAGLTFEANAYAYVTGGQAEIALVYPQDRTPSSAGAPWMRCVRRTCRSHCSKTLSAARVAATSW